LEKAKRLLAAQEGAVAVEAAQPSMASIDVNKLNAQLLRAELDGDEAKAATFRRQIAAVEALSSRDGKAVRLVASAQGVVEAKRSALTGEGGSVSDLVAQERLEVNKAKIIAF
jgi:hypothetical protein